MGPKIPPSVASSAAPVPVCEIRGLADPWNTGWKNPAAEPRGHTHAGFAPATVIGSQSHLGWKRQLRSSRSTTKGQKRSTSRLHMKTGLSPAPSQASGPAAHFSCAGNCRCSVEVAIPTQTPEPVSCFPSPLQCSAETRRGKTSQLLFLQQILSSYTCSSGCLMQSGL